MIAQPLFLAFLAAVASDAFAPSIPRRSAVSLFASSSNVDDVSNSDGPSDDNSDSNLDDLASEYIEDVSTNEAESLDEAPSDVAVDDAVVSETFEEEPHLVPSESIEKPLTTLLQISASTGRGEFATNDQKDQAAQLIASIEQQNPTPEPTKSPLAYGRWDLLYSSTQLFRSSPFFMAGRAVCTTPEQAQQYDWFCDMHRKALAISSIGQVRQIVSPSQLISEFEVQVGAVPFLSDFTPFSYSGGWPVKIEGAIVSSADITPTEDGNAWELLMDTVEIKGSNMPGLRKVLDQGLKLSSRQLGDFLENNVDSYSNPKPIFKTTYLSENIRISQDQDGKVFVYGKMSDDTEPSDYSSVDADLGVLKLLEGFNDSITKFYL